MDIQNHFYGHSAAYAAHAGLSRPRHIGGLVQHGWTPITPIASHFADLASSAPAGNLFVWSHEARGWNEAESAKETGFTSTAIGSPFLYLYDLVRRSGGIPPKTLPVVVIPFHGTRLVEVEGDQRAYAREVFEKEGPAVVCLHVDDMQREDIVSAWTEAGHRITTAGERRDPAFLARILWLVTSAEKVVSNRLATALMYAAAVGTPTEIYGPHFQIKGIAETSSEEYLARIWPEFYSADTDQATLTALADAELGRGAMRTPTGLRQVLGWQSPSPRPAFDYWAGAPIEKALTVLGIKKREVGEVVDGVKLNPLEFLKHPLEHLPDPLPRTVMRRVIKPEIAQPTR
ncbi:hypothetical protein [Falsarthrobacter nasiphocae]|uniref:Uncharacterized protein n=1 Tax=Falsarthrobacter nasiphocae TaxID=189863 RepID=A0AAE4C5D8_9MICC|nr:hypothetical protein [Falsarthrobacter nasiphocae]MDR6891398.1 hypothetical protein [Falsarthrobacter nasiphocae]